MYLCTHSFRSCVSVVMPVSVGDVILGAGDNVALEVGREFMVANGEDSMKVCTSHAQEYHMRAKE